MMNKQGCGKLPLNSPQHNKMPWEKVQLDCCRPWTIRYKDSPINKVVKFEIQLLSMVDVGSGWSEFAQFAMVSATGMVIAFNKQWLCCYLCPTVCDHNNSNEFLGWEFQEMLASYGIKSKPPTVKNPTTNTIVKRIHGTLGKQLRTTIFGQDWLEDVDRLIQACAYAL